MKIVVFSPPSFCFSAIEYFACLLYMLLCVMFVSGVDHHLIICGGRNRAVRGCPPKKTATRAKKKLFFFWISSITVQHLMAFDSFNRKSISFVFYFVSARKLSSKWDIKLLWFYEGSFSQCFASRFWFWEPLVTSKRSNFDTKICVWSPRFRNIFICCNSERRGYWLSGHRSNFPDGSVTFFPWCDLLRALELYLFEFAWVFVGVHQWHRKK